MSTEEAKKISVKSDWQMFPLIHLAAGDLSYEATPVKIVEWQQQQRLNLNFSTNANENTNAKEIQLIVQTNTKW